MIVAIEAGDWNSAGESKPHGCDAFFKIVHSLLARPVICTREVGSSPDQTFMAAPRSRGVLERVAAPAEVHADDVRGEEERGCVPGRRLGSRDSK